MAPILQDYITVSEFAALCRCTRRTVYRWMDEKLIDYDTAPGGVHYISKARAAEFARKWRDGQARTRPAAHKAAGQPLAPVPEIERTLDGQAAEPGHKAEEVA